MQSWRLVNLRPSSSSIVASAPKTPIVMSGIRSILSITAWTAGLKIVAFEYSRNVRRRLTSDAATGYLPSNSSAM